MCYYTGEEGDNMKKNELGRTIKDKRKARGMTQSELAERLGVATSTVGMWETGKRVPEFETAEKLSEIFNHKFSNLTLEAGKEIDRSSLNVSAIDETINQLQNLRDQIMPQTPKTVEARIVSFGMDKLPKEDRERLLAMIRAMYANHPELFENKEGEENET